MSIAAVPEYLGSDFESASPALRFGMYLKLWGVDSRSKKNLWKKHDVSYRQTGREHKERRSEDDNKQKALCDAASLNPTDCKAMNAFVQRQRSLFEQIGASGLQLMSTSVAPFTTGLGNEHPLENGFAFINPYGLPYLPGSGVKGVLRRAAEELAHEAFFKDGQWTLPAIWHLFGFEPWTSLKNRDLAAWVDGFAVSPSEVEKYLNAVTTQSSILPIKKRVLSSPNPLHQLMQERGLHVRGALQFWDAMPQTKSDRLAMEIMTPHYSHYYREREHRGGEPPHDSGSPNPILFLTVPPDSSFTFHVVCDQQRLERTAPDLAKDGAWKTLLKGAFEHAFDWLGFGAKTAVGYGAMNTAMTEPEPSCAWVDETIAGLSSGPTSTEEQTLRGRRLAKAWAEITDPALKKEAYQDIRSRWEKNGWWETPPGKAARAAKAIYDEWEGD